MRSVTRLLFMAAVISFGLLAAGGVAAAFLAEPTVGWLALAGGGGALLLYGRKARFRGTGTLFGTARWAEWRDLAAAGYLGADRGILLGGVPPPPPLLAAGWLFRAPWGQSEVACRLFFHSFRRTPLPVRINRGVHCLVCAPTGAGKGVSLLIPHLLTDPGSCVVIDPKGENHARTAAARRRMGQRVVTLDPFGVTGGPGDSLNPLDLIDPDRREWLDDVRALCDALVVRTGLEHEPHWSEAAVLFLTGVTAFVARYEARDRTLSYVADILASPVALPRVQQQLAADPDPMLARLGGQMQQFVDRERASVLTTANRALAFLGSHHLAGAVGRTTFPLDRLRDGVTVFAVVPLMYLQSHSGYLRLLVTTLLRAVVRGGLDETRPVTLLLDEAGALGRLDPLKNALTQLRGYGLRLQVYVQSLNQLDELFPNQTQTALGAFDTQVYFGTNDYETAELVSKRVGSATRTKVDASGGTSRSRSHDHQGLPSTSVSENDGWSASEVGREVIKPDEVLALPPGVAVTFPKHTPPVLTRLPRYFDRDFRRLASPPEFGGRLLMLVRAFALAALAVGLLAAAVAAANHAIKRSAYPPPAVFPEAGPERRDEPDERVGPDGTPGGRRPRQ